jgi:hypothetical protein
VATLLAQTIGAASGPNTTIPVPFPPGPYQEAPQKLTAQGNFVAGGGGSTVTAFLQTSLDGGVTWIDIASFAFTTSSLRKIFSLTTATSGDRAGYADRWRPRGEHGSLRHSRQFAAREMVLDRELRIGRGHDHLCKQSLGQRHRHDRRNGRDFRRRERCWESSRHRRHIGGDIDGVGRVLERISRSQHLESSLHGQRDRVDGQLRRSRDLRTSGQCGDPGFGTGRDDAANRYRMRLKNGSGH